MSQKLLIDAKTQLEKTKTIIFKNQRSQLEQLYAENTRQKTREMIDRRPVETAYLSQTFRENPRLFARTNDPRLNTEITYRLALITSSLFPHLSSINGLQARLIEYIMDRLAASDDLYSNPRNQLGNIKPSPIHSIQEGANAFRNMLQSTPLKNGAKMVA